MKKEEKDKPIKKEKDRKNTRIKPLDEPEVFSTLFEELIRANYFKPDFDILTQSNQQDEEYKIISSLEFYSQQKKRHEKKQDSYTMPDGTVYTIIDDDVPLEKNKTTSSCEASPTNSSKKINTNLLKISTIEEINRIISKSDFKNYGLKKIKASSRKKKPKEDECDKEFGR
ncbi:MAG: hypothetical protein IKQ31_01545 [Clostridia bacterium]|nr:hypothetical protein [Clostridia bacterium]